MKDKSSCDEKKFENLIMNRSFKYSKTMPLSKYFIFVFIFFIAVYSMFLVLIKKNQDGNLTPGVLPQFEYNSDQNSYSVWPDFLNFIDFSTKNLLEKNKILIRKQCLKQLENKNLSIEILDEILKVWSNNDQPECLKYYKILTQIYLFQFKHNHLNLNEKFLPKVKKMLNNDDVLLNSVYNQELVNIYNKYTNEENVFNSLRPKRPVSKPEMPPAKFYEKTINETESICDFCNEDYTAFSGSSRIRTGNSYSAANLFPFDENHELFLPRKHDLLKLNYLEFKDLLSLPDEWFNKLHFKDKNLNYPVVLWDFMYKAGASQVHPHLHGTINSNRYYGMFETIRKGAEIYYRETKRNYFNDFTLLHDMLNLTLVHKNSLLVYSLTPKKDYDVTILSQNFGEDVIELLYAVLQTYFYDLEIYPFSLSIYFPFMDSSQNGRIPVYIKLIPRGDISSLRSDASTLELLSTFNANLDQFNTSIRMSQFIQKRLLGLK